LLKLFFTQGYNYEVAADKSLTTLALDIGVDKREAVMRGKIAWKGIKLLSISILGD